MIKCTLSTTLFLFFVTINVFVFNDDKNAVRTFQPPSVFLSRPISSATNNKHNNNGIFTIGHNNDHKKNNFNMAAKDVDMMKDDHNNNDTNNDINDDDNDIEYDDDDDTLLLQTVETAQLEELCDTLNLSMEGSKKELLYRLREYAKVQTNAEKERLRKRNQKVKDGIGNHTKERYEVVDDKNDNKSSQQQGNSIENYFNDVHNNNNDDDDDNNNIEGEEGDVDDDVVFYYPAALLAKEKETKNDADTTITTTATTTKSGTGFGKKEMTIDDTVANKKPREFVTNEYVTAPPCPPGLEENEDGERVVTIYSTNDKNDLTGVAASQPGQQNNDVFTSTMPSANSISLGNKKLWDVDNKNIKKEATSQELESAKLVVTNLIEKMLLTTGAPGFSLYKDDDDNYDDMMLDIPAEGVFVGFDPSNVPSDMLSKAISSLNAGRGSVLQDALYDFEMHAIGQDGMNSDDITKGGGHYHEISKVRAFLEGFRQAELRRVARETLQILIEKMIFEGIDGLDLMLASMTRSSDDDSSTTSSNSCELNDSLLDHLNDVIRQQQEKVSTLQSNLQKNAVFNPTTTKEEGQTLAMDNNDGDHDPLATLWNVTLDDDGKRSESINPNDPTVLKLLKEEMKKQNDDNNNDNTGIFIDNDNSLTPKSPINDIMTMTGPEKLLLLLTQLRERIKIEAVYGGKSDGKGFNLRVLAYCLQLSTDQDRQILITKECGSSIDRMDSFIELLKSSVEYGESTTHQFLQPSKKKPLNVKLIKRILRLTQHIKKNQTFKATGLKP